MIVVLGRVVFSCLLFVSMTVQLLDLLVERYLEPLKSESFISQEEVCVCVCVCVCVHVCVHGGGVSREDISHP